MSTHLIPLQVVPAKLDTSKRDSRFYAPELDILRFGAFLLVFCRHVSNALGATKYQSDHSALPVRKLLTPDSTAPTLRHINWEMIRESLQAFDFGVCLFFFLSAFLITRLLLLEKERTGSIDIPSFYTRRCLRIWPLYFTFLTLIFLASFVFPVLHVSGLRFLAAIIFVANWVTVFHGWGGIAIQPLWSISVEEQFYLIWPIFSRYGKAAIVCASCFCISLSIGTLFYIGHLHGVPVTYSWPNTCVQALFLGGGALTACFWFPERRRLPLISRCTLIFSGSALWIIASGGLHIVRIQSPGSAQLITGYLLVLVGTFLIFTGFAGWKGAQFHPRLITLGKISYGLYVFHAACLLLMEEFIKSTAASLHLSWLSSYALTGIATALALTLTLLCALVSYRYLETPFLRMKDRFAVVKSRPA